MKKVTRNLLATGGILAVGATSIIGLGTASAQTATTSGQSSLISKIASKFGLSETEVKAVFDEDRAEHQAQHEAAAAERLAQAVSDGDLTQEQADKITAKLAELKAEREANRPDFESLTDEERQAHREAMKTKIDELKTWAEANDIPMEYLRMGGRGPGGPRGDMGPPPEAGSTYSNASTNTN